MRFENIKYLVLILFTCTGVFAQSDFELSNDQDTLFIYKLENCFVSLKFGNKSVKTKHFDLFGKYAFPIFHLNDTEVCDPTNNYSGFGISIQRKDGTGVMPSRKIRGRMKSVKPVADTIKLEGGNQIVIQIYIPLSGYWLEKTELYSVKFFYIQWSQKSDFYSGCLWTKEIPIVFLKKKK